MKEIHLALIAMLLIVPVILVAAGVTASQVDYPQQYRGWHHVKSMVIEKGHPLADPFQGIHHVYANDKALKGLKSGDYPDGAILVFDLLESKSKEHALQEGQRKLIGVMERDASRFKRTGGWGYEAYKGDSRRRLTQDRGEACYQCHQAVASRQFVFSRLRP